MLSLQNCLSHDIMVANIRPCNQHLALKQCSSFSQSFYPSFAQTVLKQVVRTSSVCQRIRNTHLQFNCYLNLCGNLCHLIGWYTKDSQTETEFVQTTGQAVRHASQWLKLECCSSTSWRLHGPILPASVLFSGDIFD